MRRCNSIRRVSPPSCILRNDVLNKLCTYKSETKDFRGTGQVEREFNSSTVHIQGARERLHRSAEDISESSQRPAFAQPPPRPASWLVTKFMGCHRGKKRTPVNLPSWDVFSGAHWHLLKPWTSSRAVEAWWRIQLQNLDTTIKVVCQRP